MLNLATKQENSHIFLIQLKFALMLGKKTNVDTTLFQQKKNYSILEIAKMFNRPLNLYQKRLGERYASSLTKMYLTNQIINKIGKKEYKKIYSRV